MFLERLLFYEVIDVSIIEFHMHFILVNGTAGNTLPLSAYPRELVDECPSSLSYWSSLLSTSISLYQLRSASISLK